MKKQLTIETITINGIETEAVRLMRSNDTVDEACLCCGRKVVINGTQHWVRVAYNGYIVPTAIALPEQMDLGYFTVGPECIKRFTPAFILTTNN